MMPSEEVYWRDKNKGRTLEGIILGTVIKRVSKLVPSCKSLPGRSSCKLNSWLSSEHLSWPYTKSTTASIVKR